MKVILLAAGVGKRFGKRTQQLPKCLIPLGPGGETLLSRYLRAFVELNVRKVVIVVGHEQKQIRRACLKHLKELQIRFLVNRRYRLGSIVSLWTAIDELNEDCLIMDADVYFETRQLRGLLRKKGSLFLMDPRSKSSGEEMMLMTKSGRLVRIAKMPDKTLRAVGEATGFLKLTQKDARRLAVILGRMVRAGRTRVEYEDAYIELMKKSRLGTMAIRGFWTEMDFEEDLDRIKKRPKHK